MAGGGEVEAEKKRAAGTASRAEAAAVGAVAMEVMLTLAGNQAEAGNRAEPKRQARTARRCIGARERGRGWSGGGDGCVLVSGFEVVRLCGRMCARERSANEMDGLRVRKERVKPRKCAPSPKRGEV